MADIAQHDNPESSVLDNVATTERAAILWKLSAHSSKGNMVRQSVAVFGIA